MTRVGGKGVKYVTAHWVLESIKAGKRLPEAQFSGLNLNPKGSKGVYGMLQKARSEGSGLAEEVAGERKGIEGGDAG